MKRHASSGIWTHVADSIFNDNGCYAENTLRSHEALIFNVSLPCNHQH